MDFTVEIFGKKFAYNMTLGELIGEYAITQWGYIENSVMDGYMDEFPEIDEFANELYHNIVSGEGCEIITDEGIGFDMVFPEAVRFIGKREIIAIITNAMRGSA